jgi:hypothetical protein
VVQKARHFVEADVAHGVGRVLASRFKVFIARKQFLAGGQLVFQWAELLSPQRHRRWGLGAALKAIDMNSIKAIAFALIAAGILGLDYGGFSYTKDTTVVKLGSIELTAKETETINIPMWAGIGAIVVGGLLLVVGGKK